MKATYDETILMDGLLLVAREELAETEEVEAGRTARLVLYNDKGECKRFVLPFRVIAHARKAMGVPTVPSEGFRVVFSSRGITVSLTPTLEGYIAVTDTIIARLESEHRQRCRDLRQRIAKLKKGGAAL